MCQLTSTLSQVVAALKETGVAFDTFDILGDEAVRQGLKEYSNWPTYPQLYVKGELLGGCDIILEMAAEGELKQTLEESLGVESKEVLHARIKALLEGSPVMLFMKGSPSEPKCGFSRKVREPSPGSQRGAKPAAEQTRVTELPRLPPAASLSLSSSETRVRFGR